MARTPDGKWIIFRKSDGVRFERWSIDARSMLDSGEYTPDTLTDISGTVTPDVEHVAAAIDPVPHVTAAKLAAEAVSPTGAPLHVGAVVGVTQGVAVPTRSQGRRR